MIKLLLLTAFFAQYTIPMRTGSTAAGGGGGGTVISYTQGGTPATGAAHAVNCATTGSVASGDLLLFTTKYQSTSTSGVTLAVTTASGPATTWSSATALANSNPGYWSAVAWGIAGSSGTETATGTWTGGIDAGFIDCTIVDMNATHGWNASPLDVQVSSFNASAVPSCDPGTTLTTTNPNDLVVGVCFNFNVGQTYVPVAGYTFQTASSRNTTAFYWKSVSTVGTQTISVPITSDVFTGFILTFKAN